MIQTERVVRIAPERPDPLPEPSIRLEVLVPGNEGEKLQGDYVYVIMEWDEFLDFAAYMEQVGFKFKELNDIIDYWEEGNNE